ncbi:MAG TPA: tRNA preQ1(34) S-adenosylmethionine ribosyltransferase-isomerase QueA [Gammaproteobacteria bacterium]|nr:tRNA preQ1(34) S-adenosylmethionine ribosyltransferase-isomerase QueA [Gammaproteobacteria bacterium]
MRLEDFHFELPSRLIAHYPLSRRSDSRLLCLNNATGEVSHRQFDQLVDLLRQGDLLIFNDTKVIPARLLGYKITGGRVEVLVERMLDEQSMLAQVHVSKSPRIGDRLIFSDEIYLDVTNKQRQFYELSYRQTDKTILEVVEELGQVPLPPYMQRPPEKSDQERYQTVYAKHKGAVAAPTAGLHFDEDVLRALRKKQIEFGFLTLHIGSGTFTPVRTKNIQEHTMHAEHLKISSELCNKIIQAKAEGRRIVAVGTTSLRALETASQQGSMTPYDGETNIFIYPGYQFRCVDMLITNLHLSGSTLLMLVCAFGGYKNVMRAYRLAIKESYRFYSYGDAMLVFGGVHT